MKRTSRKYPNIPVVGENLKGKFEDHQEKSGPKYPNCLGILDEYIYHE